MYYASSAMSASRESVIHRVITSCEWCVWKLLRLGNLESRCGFSYGGLLLMLACVRCSGRHRVWDDAAMRDVWSVVSLWYRAFTFPFATLFSSAIICWRRCIADICSVREWWSKYANYLKNRQKCLVGSDFLRIFARYLCVLRPRVREKVCGRRCGSCGVKCR